MKAAAKNQIEVIEAVVKAKLEQCGADSKSIDIPTLVSQPKSLSIINEPILYRVTLFSLL